MESFLRANRYVDEEDVPCIVAIATNMGVARDRLETNTVYLMENMVSDVAWLYSKYERQYRLSLLRSNKYHGTEAVPLKRQGEPGWFIEAILNSDPNYVELLKEVESRKSVKHLIEGLRDGLEQRKNAINYLRKLDGH